jgi:hypothetical protein
MNAKIKKVADELGMKIEAGGCFERGGCHDGVCGMWNLHVDIPEFHDKGFERVDGVIYEENVASVIEKMRDTHGYWKSL